MSTRPSTGVAAIAIGVFVAATISACGSANDAAPPSEPTGVEQPVNPDISAEQNAFLADLLATPLPQDEATQRIEEAGYTWRLGTIDGEPQAVTMDYRIDRLTLTTQDGLVIDATWG